MLYNHLERRKTARNFHPEAKMMRMFKKTTASTAKRDGSIATEQFDIVENLSSWEFVDASESDDGDLYSLDGFIIDSEEAEEKSEEDENITESRDFVHPDDLISMSLSVPPTIDFRIDDLQQHVCFDDDDDSKEEEEEEDGGGDGDSDAEYNDDVNDELIPWKLKDKFEKQRIRKLGKRGAKMTKSKRLPYYCNRPGCLYGKHGLGVQHTYI